MKKQSHKTRIKPNINWVKAVFFLILIVFLLVPEYFRDYSIPEEWETFESVDGWRISYPKGWDRKIYGHDGFEGYPDQRAYFGRRSDHIRLRIYYREMEDKSIEAVQKFSLEILEERGGDRITTLYSKANENYRAYFRTAHCFHRSDCKYVYIVTESGVFTLEYQVSIGHLDKTLPIFDLIVDSFYVIED